MEIPYFKCSHCGEDYRDHEDYRHYPECHENVQKPKCVNCGKPTLVFHVDSHEYKHQIWFDYAHQCYRNADGSLADVTNIEDDFSCPRCYGPATLQHVTAYYESYECNNCTHTFKVD